MVLALMASGFNGQQWRFVGYLPVDDGERRSSIVRLENLVASPSETQIIMETPYRNQALAQSLLENLAPDTWLSVACGLTLETGWNRTLRVSQWQQRGLSLPDNIPAVFAWLAP